MISFNKIVNKMLKKWWKILFKEDIFEIIDPEKKDQYKNYLDKVIYRLKSENIIISLKAWVYIVPSQDDKTLNKIDLIEKYYIKILKKYISYYVWSNYYITWKKALEFHLKNYEVQDKIFIITKDLNKKIKLWNYEIIFKTISWKQEWKKINLYSLFSTYTLLKSIDGIEFKLSCLELSLVETALVNDNEQWIPIEILSKTIKKYKWVFNNEIFYSVWKYKYIMSFNRLKEISKNLDKDLYNVFLDIIKKNWWLFIWEGLRWF
jgi:hypothetical protein